MADLLASLEASLTQNAGASERLRTLLSRIDEYMSTQRLQENFSAVPDIAQQSQQQAIETTGTQMNFDTSNIPEFDGQLSFQLPQELLVDWPWPFDWTQGFGTSNAFG